MKRLVLLLIGMLMGLTTASASEFHHDKKKKRINKVRNYRNAQPITFLERGIEFYVFPDGSFDFNTHFNESNNYYRFHSKRRTVNTTFGAPNRNGRYNRYGDRGISISHDRDGKIRRIGNVFLNYDRYGKIKRIGNVYMSYNRGYGRLNQVGGLFVDYNKWGEIINTNGVVNWDNRNFRRNNNTCNNNWEDGDDIYDDEDTYHYYRNR
ncbi:hypothetical protein [Seonamhaeicola marinus]|uniref:WG repeat-containing protein n=1 Tax=Seonamhaeicola marinus TaxID=1912246 RepID=A0A5D0HLI2_9FLAO|nr:hypothetical protein [Seonamhaeicola marinus]TYA71840.1 hypothetical protein FUA24_20020 [Seonamhaeicola marinus]